MKNRCFIILELMLCMGVFLFPATAYKGVNLIRVLPESVKSLLLTAE